MRTPRHSRQNDPDAHGEIGDVIAIPELPKVSRNSIVLPPLGKPSPRCSHSAPPAGRHRQRNPSEQRRNGSTSQEEALTGDVQGGICERKQEESLWQAASVVPDSVAAATRTETSCGHGVGEVPPRPSRNRDTTCAVEIDQQEDCPRFDGSQDRRSAESESGVAADGADATRAVGTGDREETGSRVDVSSGEAVVDGSPPDPKLARRAGDERNPLSPVAAMRARLGGGLRNLLTAGSEAQVSPAPASPSRSTVVDMTRTPHQDKRPGTKRLSPLPWGRMKPGRNKIEVVPAAFFGDSPEENLGNGDDNGGNDNGGDEIPSPRFNDGATFVSEDLKAGKDPTSDLDHGPGALSDRQTNARGAPPASGPAAADNAPKVLARENTLVLRDEWPELLDDEADPAEWALDKGEDEVRAAATRMGSVLVRVVTWNLHAKSTPEADKLREALLPPGKVCEGSSRCIMHAVHACGSAREKKVVACGTIQRQQE